MLIRPLSPHPRSCHFDRSEAEWRNLLLYRCASASHIIRRSIPLHRPIPNQRQILPRGILTLNQNHLLLPPPPFDLLLASDSRRGRSEALKPDQSIASIHARKAFKPHLPMLFDPYLDVAGKPHIQHAAPIRDKIHIKPSLFAQPILTIKKRPEQKLRPETTAT